ncbi:tyrosine-type recombinase/integrase [Paracidovorax konjaci]|uniref:Site-specific recombinase XerD n=1 Tax=Paracidovorax konjaci TaxID=32040 RepID=A0A1I1X198_9BURK|nr:tyrosine-type recombinase/integrase [Paracidovorax konjaci]SFE01102.1 Site-specific recombinase XerD [Paracidovorax konjaci]
MSVQPKKHAELHVRQPLWRMHPELQSRLNCATIPAGTPRFRLQSSGDEVELSPRVVASKNFTVTDGKGVIVRTASSWLRKIQSEVGHSYADGTVPQYGRILTYLVRSLEESPSSFKSSIDERILRFNRNDLVTWLTHMKELGIKRSTRQGREACLKEFFLWLCTEEGGRLRDEDYLPWGRVGMTKNVTKRSNAKSPKFIETSHVTDLLLKLHNECERVMFHAQYDMGLRIAELVGLKRKDLPDERSYAAGYELIPICINGVKGRAGQGKERITLISRAVLRRIKAYHATIEYKLAPDWDVADPNKPVFLTINQLVWSVRNASKQFKNAVRRAGLHDDFCTHWLRHGTAFSVLRSDVGEEYTDRMLIVQKMLGHNELSTTEIYTQISPHMLDKLTKKGRQINRLEEAEDIRFRTYIGSLQHKEKRGHRHAKRHSDNSPARANSA